MGNILRFVYDDWDEENNVPRPNRLKTYKQEGVNSAWLVSTDPMRVFSRTVIENYRLEDVVNNPTQVYFYHVWFRMSLYPSFLSNNILPIDDKIINFAKENLNFHLVFMNEGECEPKVTLERLHEITTTLGLNQRQIWLINNNEKLGDYKKEIGTFINVHTTRSLSTIFNINFNNSLHVKYKAEKEPGSFFLCHNRSGKLHRYALLAILDKYGLLDDTDWSLINRVSRLRYDSLLSNSDIEDLALEINRLNAVSQKRSKYEVDNVDYQKSLPVLLVSPDTYENSYVNIATENSFLGQDIHITEKSFKPFFYFQFPLILASYHHGYYFRKAYPDLDFFDDVIDHSYDNIENDRDRLFAFVNEVKKINSNKEFFIKFYRDNKARFDRNHAILLNYENNYDYNFFNKISNLDIKEIPLNFVFDEWDEERNTPKANRPKIVDFEEDPVNVPWLVSENPMAVFESIKVVNRRLEDVIKYTNELFFYHVWHRDSIYWHFLNKDKLPVDDEIIRMVNQNPNLHLVLMNECEFESKKSLELLDKIIVRLKLNPKQVWFINNNEKLEDYRVELNSGINVHTTRSMCNVVHFEDGKLNFKEEKDFSTFFLCHNKSPRFHRYALLCLLKKYGILDSVDWSLVGGWHNNKEHYRGNCLKFFNQEQFDDLASEIDYFGSIEVKKSKYETDYTQFDDRTNQVLFFERATYENSYFNIVTETNYFDQDIHITEKSFKPFYFQQFPLILASYHHGHRFRAAYPEYDFFDDIIDHSYDNIESDRDRIFAFANEIRRINDNKEVFAEFYKNNRERFIKNHEIAKNFKNTYDYTFFKGLSELPVIENGTTLNLVYDNWDEYVQYPSEPNCKEVYTDCFMMNIDSAVVSLNFPMNYVVRYPLGDVPKYPDRKFYYFITLTPNQVLYKIRDGELPMPKEVISYLLKYPNFNVIMMNEQEFETFESVKAVHEWSRVLKINQKQLWISNNNIKLDDYKKALDSDINFYATSKVRDHIALAMEWKMADLEHKVDKQGAFFLCHNRRPRPHRYALLALLKKQGILEEIDWSLVNGWEAKDKEINFYYSVLSDNHISELKEEIAYLHNIEQKKSKYEEEYNWFDDKENTDYVNWGETYVTSTYENSYFNITTETEYSSDTLHISEKSFKSFYAMQFPLILASPNHITEIRKHYDFDWFDDVLNHGYDKILDHKERLLAFVEEIKRINSNKEFFIEFYNKNKHRFIKNHERALKWARNPKDTNFLLGLCGLPLIPYGEANKKKLI